MMPSRRPPLRDITSAGKCFDGLGLAKPLEAGA